MQQSIITYYTQISKQNTIFISDSSVIRQKGESQNGCFEKTKHAEFSETRTFFTLWYPIFYPPQEVKNVRFSENLACFAFLKHPFWGSPFWLINNKLQCKEKKRKNHYLCLGFYTCQKINRFSLPRFITNRSISIKDANWKVFNFLHRMFQLI